MPDLGDVLAAAAAATSSPPAVRNLCRYLTDAAQREDEGARLAELADAATVDRTTAAAVIRTLAGTAAALGGLTRR